MLMQKALGCRSPERRLPCQHLEQHTGQSVLVASSVQVFFPSHLLRTDVGRSAQRCARLRESFILCLGHGMGDTEISQDRMARLKHDVGWFDVSVDDALFVRISEGTCDLPGDSDRIIEREILFVCEAGAKGITLHKRHDEEEEAVGFPGIMQRQDMGVSQVGYGFDLEEESFCADSLGQLWVEHFHSHLAVVLQILGQIDGGHPSTADLPVDAVAVRECRPQPFFDVLV